MTVSVGGVAEVWVRGLPVVAQKQLEAVLVEKDKLTEQGSMKMGQERALHVSSNVMSVEEFWTI